VTLGVDAKRGTQGFSCAFEEQCRLADTRDPSLSVAETRFVVRSGTKKARSLNTPAGRSLTVPPSHPRRRTFKIVSPWLLNIYIF